MEEIIKLDEVDKYNKFFGLETRHPLVSVVDLSKATRWPEHFRINYWGISEPPKFSCLLFYLHKIVAAF